MFQFNFLTPTMVAPADALPGRATPVLKNPAPHTVLGTDILAEPTPTQEVIYLASGCFWGAEKLMWNSGADTTAVGYMGGFTPNPTYEEVCTNLTGHAETVRVVFTPTKVSAASLLRAFFESHDPTSLNQQGNDVGTQYRSAIFTTTPEQTALATEMIRLYQEALSAAGRGKIVTEVRSAAQAGPFYPAEDYHQQYLTKVVNGYECHSRTGVACPMPESGPLAEILRKEQ